MEVAEGGVLRCCIDGKTYREVFSKVVGCEEGREYRGREGTEEGRKGRRVGSIEEFFPFVLYMF